jgi:putative flippase GtrA
VPSKPTASNPTAPDPTAPDPTAENRIIPDLHTTHPGTTSRPSTGRPSPASGPDRAGGRDPDGDEGAGPVRFARLRRSPLVRRITGYSAGSVIAAFTSELAFAGAFGWLHADTTWASLAGFIGGAIPNYFLNRRWAWQGRNGRSRRSEITLYAAVSIASFLVSVVVTDAVERWAKHLTASSGLRVVLVAAAYLAVSGVFFVGKFVAYEFIVFTKGPAEPAGSASRSDGPSTTS